MKLVRGLSRRLTYANVIASIALFAALGGGAYAANKINGNSIKGKSIGGGKLKNETITAKQIKKGTLNSSVINESSLTTVPSATSAQTAETANSAKSAESARTAETATTANHATSADSATSAKTAETATSADTATEAGHAATAGDAEALEGQTAAELTVSCQGTTEPYGGMCWDENVRPIQTWLAAVKQCGDAGGRLPSLGELIAFVSQDNTQVTGPNWSDDVEGFEGGVPKILIRDEGPGSESSATASSTFGFRCVFYRTNG